MPSRADKGLALSQDAKTEQAMHGGWIASNGPEFELGKCSRLVRGSLRGRAGRPRFDKVSSFIPKKVDVLAERITAAEVGLPEDRESLNDFVAAVGDRAAF
jgi:hypothetical protein